ELDGRIPVAIEKVDLVQGFMELWLQIELLRRLADQLEELLAHEVSLVHDAVDLDHADIDAQVSGGPDDVQCSALIAREDSVEFERPVPSRQQWLHERFD